MHSKKSFRDIVNLYPEFFIFGIESPDRIFKDTTNHYYNCTPNEFGYNSGSIISRIEYLVDLCDEMILNPNKIILIKKLQPYIVSMLDTPLKSFIYTLGALTHYISDLHQPFHTDGKYTGLDETTVHKIFEADTRQHLNDLKITLKRRKRIKNIKKEDIKICEDLIFNVYDDALFTFIKYFENIKIDIKHPHDTFFKKIFAPHNFSVRFFA